LPFVFVDGLFDSDEIMVSIPNADLLKERVSNLSRVRNSQVKQIIRLRYDDVDKIPTLIKEIKYEIKKHCPSVILDGSRPFRVHWTAINDDHCEITIDTRHLIKPVGDAYLDNKQNVLTAIYSALKRYNCKLVEAPIVAKMR
jgi:Mechanosensitive ion channel